MNGRTVALLVLLGLLVAALFLLSVGLDGGGQADPEDSGGIEAIGDVLGGLPGLASDLQAEQVDADCFEDGRFAASVSGCVFEVSADVDRIRLGLVAGPCLVVIEQADAVPQRLDSGRHFRNGRVDVSLTGEPAVVSIAAQTQSGCVLELNPD